MKEAIFYQFVEYVVAPFALMVFTFYVKNLHKKDSFEPNFQSHGIESLFIACFSHFLYYFSIRSHSHGDELKFYEITTASSCLLASGFGLMSLFMMVYYIKLWDEADFRSKTYPFTGAIVLMVFLIFLIGYKNHHSFHLVYGINYFCDWFLFLLSPDELIIVIPTIIGGFLFFKNVPIFTSKTSRQVEKYLENIDVEIESSADLGDVGREKDLPNFARIQAYLMKARSIIGLNEVDQLDEAMKSLLSAKDLADSDERYPMNLYYVIVKMLVEVYILIGMSSFAAKVIDHFEDKYKSANSPDWIEFGANWVEQLRKKLPH